MFDISKVLVGLVNSLIFRVILANMENKAYYVCLRRSSLLPDLDTTVFWSDVRVLPTENFLSLRVLVGSVNCSILMTVIKTHNSQLLAY